jgi:hypothetical protein
MARKRKNLGMWFALAIGGFYLYKQYQNRQAAAAASIAIASQPPATISSSVVTNTSGS